MADRPRRAQKARNETSKSKSQPKAPKILYQKDEGLAIKANNSFRFCIALEDVLAKNQSFLALTLKEAGQENKYQKLKEERIPIGDVIMEAVLKKDGKFFKITKKQLQDVKNTFKTKYKQLTIDGKEDESEEEEQEEIKQPVKKIAKKSASPKPKEEKKNEKASPVKKKVEPAANARLTRSKSIEESQKTKVAKKKSPEKIVKNELSYEEESEEESEEEKPAAKTQKPRRADPMDEDFSEEDVKPKKRTAAKSQKAAKPIKKAKNPKLPTTYKKGKYNPAVQVLDFTKHMLDPSNDPFFDVSVLMNNKNLHRACATNNKALFKKLLNSKEKISSILAPWSADCRVTGLELAIMNNNDQFVKEIVKEVITPTIKRAHPPQVGITQVGTGSVSIEAYGVMTRKVQMSRGGREGNNAFLGDIPQNDHINQLVYDVKWLERLYLSNCSENILNLLRTMIPNFENTICGTVGECVRAGNIALSSYLMALAIKNGGYGFNMLHEEVFKDGPLSPFKKVSITKKPIMNYLVAPLHCACINPDSTHLKELISQCDDINYPDMEGRKSIHYAAACTSAEPLKVLLDHGMNPNDMSRDKMTPLMVAAKLNRVENAEILLGKGVNANIKDKKGYAALHYAAEYGCIEMIKCLLEHGATVDQPGPDRKTPMMLASVQGHFECVQVLIDNKAKVLKRDKCRRTALTLAVKNGQAKVVSLLLQNGSDFNDPDSSKNYPIHYAAAYGWIECIDLLIQAGADINAVNDWKLQPLLVAMLMGQTGCVDRLLKEPNCDVNCKDEEGRTLLSQAIEMLSIETLSQIKFLLKEKGADPNIADRNGMTALHYLCRKGKPVCQIPNLTPYEIKDWEDQASDFQHEALELLIEFGADVNLKCKSENTPLLYALQAKNIRIFQALIHKEADLAITSKNGGGIFHKLACLDTDFLGMYHQLLNMPRVVSAAIDIVDDNGFTPFLKLIDEFASNHSTAWQKIYDLERKIMTNELEEQKKIAKGEMLVETASPSRPAVHGKISGKGPSKTIKQPVPESSEEDEDVDFSDKVVHGKITSKRPAKSIKNATFINNEDFSQGLAMLSEGQLNQTQFSQVPAMAIGGQFNLVQTPTDPAMGFQSNQAQPTLFFQNFNSEAINLNYQELERRSKEKFAELVEIIRGVLVDLINHGANPAATVEKLLKYKENPDLIYQEEKESQIQDAGGVYNRYGQSEQRKFFITDIDGTKKYKEYGDKGQQNALHLIAMKPEKPLLDFLLSLPIPINQRDFYGDTPLILFVKAVQHVSAIKTLIDHNADPNIYNCENEGPLLKAIQHNLLDIIDLLIKNRAMIEVTSKLGKTPLTLAVEMKNVKIARKLCEAGASVNFKDPKGRTALHIAINSAEATSDASFDMESLLLHFGANINAVDNRGRCPLHYAFVKIGRPFDKSQIDPIETVSSACSRSDINVNIQDQWKKTPLHYAAQRGALTSTMFMLAKGAKIDTEDEDGNTSLGISIKFGHANYAIMLIQKDANVNKLLIIKPAEEKNEEEVEENRLGLFGGARTKQTARSGMFGGMSRARPTKPSTNSSLPQGTYSMFRAAIIQGWQGAAYLMLYNGYPYMLAMQDAMNEMKFKLVKTLLAKVGDDKKLQEINEDGQNLFHTLAIKGSAADQEITQIICDELFERGVDLFAVDNKGKTPLHYAAASGYRSLCQFLLGKGSNHALPDNNGIVPLAYALQGSKILTSEQMILIFRGYGASLSFTFREDGIDLTPILHAISQKGPPRLITFLLQNGCSLTEVDSLGRNAVMLAIINNDIKMVEALIKEGSLDINHSDKKGRNAAHYAVQPLEYGSYENIDILKLLISSKINAGKFDNEGWSPFCLAALQRSRRMAKLLEAHRFKVSEYPERRLSVFEPSMEVDYEKDAESYLQKQSELVKEEKIKRLPDNTQDFPDYYEVVDDYDLYMTKVDLQYGPYSQYLFYRMQLLHDTNRDNYIIFTRWGRIGEVGAFQRTPFADRNEAETEFKKIFKSKSGNEWREDFVRIKGKYVKVEFAKKKISHKDFINDFDLERAPNSNLVEELQVAVKHFTKNSIYRSYFDQSGIDVNVLNFSSISRETILEAEEIIRKIAVLVGELRDSQDVDKNLDIKQEISDLSSRYYELIPSPGFEHTAVSPILAPLDVKAKLDTLDSLKNIQIASKIILGAINSQDSINPLDYTYLALNTSLNLVDSKSPEFNVIEKYMKAGRGDDTQILGLFQVNRRGEAEKIEKFKNIEQRKLLWHGTGSANIIGILTQGLRIAPPEVPNMGWMFGKGVYFADMFMKSLGYAHSEAGDTSFFMLLCEVVLGKTYDRYQSEYVEKLPEGFLSTLGKGQEGPDCTQSIYLPNGVEVPLGPIIEQEKPNNEPYWSLNMNEYIVYNTDQIRIRYLLHLKSEQPMW
ncbi:unnamed protein product [Blepharisma stoltei]|uniref:Poly [ADP-ribose] polymerase n=1 Tax=Blepharisma stoltei TaxID=1481888 RepID=A0AAU9IUR9_9CILI|nr:unnamed protein product [Blepharisma stoltei]